MIPTFFLKKSLMDYTFHKWFTLVSINQFFIIMTSLSRFLTPNLQHHKHVNILNYFENFFSLDLGPQIHKNLSYNKKEVKKSYFMELL
jgi:hypothetical protein